jgi:hypothetical protein
VLLVIVMLAWKPVPQLFVTAKVTGVDEGGGSSVIVQVPWPWLSVAFVGLESASWKVSVPVAAPREQVEIVGLARGLDGKRLGEQSAVRAAGKRIGVGSGSTPDDIAKGLIIIDHHDSVRWSGNSTCGHEPGFEVFQAQFSMQSFGLLPFIGRWLPVGTFAKERCHARSF